MGIELSGENLNFRAFYGNFSVEERLYKERVAHIICNTGPVTIKDDFLYGREARAAKRLEVRLHTGPILRAFQGVD